MCLLPLSLLLDLPVHYMIWSPWQLAARVCVHRALFSSSISVWQEGKAHMTAWQLGLASTVGLPWAADSDWSKGQKCKSKWWTGAVAAIVTG